MRSLKPLTIFVGGSALLAIAVAAIVLIVHPASRNPRHVAISLALGTTFGMLVFGAITAGDTLRFTFVRRHYVQFERWSTFIPTLGLGHCLGLWLGDNGIFWAIACMFLGALFRIYLSGLANRRAV